MASDEPMILYKASTPKEITEGLQFDAFVGETSKHLQREFEQTKDTQRKFGCSRVNTKLGICIDTFRLRETKNTVIQTHILPQTAVIIHPTGLPECGYLFVTYNTFGGFVPSASIARQFKLMLRKTVDTIFISFDKQNIVLASCTITSGRVWETIGGPCMNVVIKSIRRDEKTTMDAFFEQRIHEKVPHTSIAKLLYIAKDDDLIHLCYEPGTHWCVADEASKTRKEEHLQIIVSVALDCLEGLIALHEKGVTHMDFKKQNTVLVNGRVKLIDIGFALDSERADRYTMQTTSYAAPEVRLKTETWKENRGPKCDIWSFGVMLMELLKPGWTFLPEELEPANLKRGMHLLEIPNNLHPIIRQIILECFQFDPEKRPNAQSLADRLRKIQTTRLTPKRVDLPTIHHNMIKSFDVQNYSEFEEIYQNNIKNGSISLISFSLDVAEDVATPCSPLTHIDILSKKLKSVRQNVLNVALFGTLVDGLIQVVHLRCLVSYSLTIESILNAFNKLKQERYAIVLERGIAFYAWLRSKIITKEHPRGEKQQFVIDLLNNYMKPLEHQIYDLNVLKKSYGNLASSSKEILQHYNYRVVGDVAHLPAILVGLEYLAYYNEFGTLLEHGWIAAADITSPNTYKRLNLETKQEIYDYRVLKFSATTNSDPNFDMYILDILNKYNFLTMITQVKGIAYIGYPKEFENVLERLVREVRLWKKVHIRSITDEKPVPKKHSRLQEEDINEQPRKKHKASEKVYAHTFTDKRYLPAQPQ